MGLIKPLGICIIGNNDNPNNINQLQANHNFTICKTIDGKKEWKFLPNNTENKKWELISDVFEGMGILITPPVRNEDDLYNEILIDNLEDGLYSFEKTQNWYVDTAGENEKPFEHLRYFIGNSKCNSESGESAEDGNCSENAIEGILPNISSYTNLLVNVTNLFEDVDTNLLFNGKSKLLIKTKGNKKVFTLHLEVPTEVEIMDTLVFVKENYYKNDKLILATDWVLQNDIMIENAEVSIGYYGSKAKNIYRQIVFINANEESVTIKFLNKNAVEFEELDLILNHYPIGNKNHYIPSVNELDMYYDNQDYELQFNNDGNPSLFYVIEYTKKFINNWHKQLEE